MTSNFSPAGRAALLFSCAVLVLAGCANPTTAESAGPHDPPPPQGPPITTDSAAIESDLGMIFLRSALTDEGDQIIADFNADSEHSLSWSSGAKPTECGYDCFGAPYISATRYFDRPNEWVAMVQAHLDFDLDVNHNFDRKIRTHITFQISCNGWRDGNGQIQVRTHNDPPFIANEPGLLEEIIDFVILPLNLSNRIDNRVSAGLGPAGTSVENRNRACSSLGIVSNFNTGQSRLDTVFWDTPEGRDPFAAQPSSQSEQIAVRFDSIERRNTQTLMDPAGAVYFDLYVNGNLLPVPNTGSILIAPGNTLTLTDMTLLIPSTGLPDLQILFVDSLGGSGWLMFARADDYGEGNHTLATHRTEIQPADSFPGPGGLPVSHKPVSVDIHEFELAFEIDYVPQPVLENPNN